MIDQDKIRLPTGQLAKLNEGRVEVISEPQQYRLVTYHSQGQQLVARSRTYANLLPFLTQLEALGYQLRSLELLEPEPGPSPL